MSQPTPAPPGAYTREVGSGWLTFAAVMFFAAALANGLWGISALANDDYFAADELLFGDLSLWGWIYLAFAVAQAGTALLILNRSNVGMIAGIALALLHGTGALMSIGAYPVWSVIALVIDGTIIYGLTVYGTAEE
jgi:hypothetical protein